MTGNREAVLGFVIVSAIVLTTAGTLWLQGASFGGERQTIEAVFKETAAPLAHGLAVDVKPPSDLAVVFPLVRTPERSAHAVPELERFYVAASTRSVDCSLAQSVSTRAVAVLCSSFAPCVLTLP